MARNTFLCISVLLTVSTGVIATTCPTCNCITKLQLLELLDISIPPGVASTETACKPVPSSIITNTPSRVITSSGRIYGAFAYGNDVFVTDFDNGLVIKLDQDGDEKGRYSVPGNPTFMEIWKGKLYVTNHVDSIYMKPVCNDEPFELFLRIDHPPISIRFTPNGQYFLVGEHLQARVGVYFADNSTLVTTITDQMPTDERVIHFDPDGNMHISSILTFINVYDSDYQFVRRITYGGSSNIDGWIFQCDGSRILADRGGKVFFIDKNDAVEREVTGFTGTGHVAVTKDGTLFVNEFEGKKINIYKQ